jgi:hypothetical protein
VRESRITRVVVALLSIALLLLCAATTPAAAHLDLAIPVLFFCFLAIVLLSLLRVSRGECALPQVAFLTVHISRPPPAA